MNRTPDGYLILSRESVLLQLREVTGVEDPVVLGRALDASKNSAGRYDLSRAVNLIIDEKPQQDDQPAGEPISHTAPSNSPKTGPKKQNVIDLTNEGSEGDDVEKAIQLSLREQQNTLGGQVSAEEQDISRVVEQSLVDSKVGTKRKWVGDAWQDPINPHERKRSHLNPVGLKNVGNTCWFSAVIQSLFHLPMFRKLVLNFTFPPDWNPEKPMEEPTRLSEEHRRILLFMLELRHLFALLVGAKRKYVDPSEALSLFKDALKYGSLDSQEDINEFTHKLLELLEQAFNAALPAGTPEQPNPLVELFYGKSYLEGRNDEGVDYTRPMKIGQIPLEVNSFHDIHECLESAMIVNIEIGSDGGEKTYRKEHQWVTDLPPVLILQLSRYAYNQQLSRPEKIHKKLDFPEVIYLDRYFEENKNITRAKREEVNKLKAEKQELESKLERYLNYGSGHKRFPLQDLLQYTDEFVESKRLNFSSDVDMTSPRPSSSGPGNLVMEPTPDNKQHDPTDLPLSHFATPPRSKSPEIKTDSNSPLPETAHCPMNEPMEEETTEKIPSTETEKMEECINSSECVGEKKEESTLKSDSEKMDESSLKPTCREERKEVSDNQLRMFQSLLKTWREEVEKEVAELEKGISHIDEKIRNMYNDVTLQKVAYKLHAVLVHEGQAASGHYWAYVYDHVTPTWRKFNDITVCPVTWEELLKESLGGYHNTSAYCLVYIDKHRSDLLDDEKLESDKDPSAVLEKAVGSLSEDLQKLVTDDNDKFQQELDSWDENQRKQAEDRKLAGSGDAECSIVQENKPATVSQDGYVLSDLQREHALLSRQSVVDIVKTNLRPDVAHDNILQKVERLNCMNLL